MKTKILYIYCTGELNKSHTDSYCHMFDMAAAEAMELEDEDPIEIPEEADLIEAERCIEDDVDLGVGREKKIMLAVTLDKASGR